MPFHSLRDTEVVCRVIQGERPTIPPNASEVGISGDLWELLVKCWNHNYPERPQIDKILQHLFQDPALGSIFPPSNLPRAPSCESVYLFVTDKYGDSSCFMLVSSCAHLSIDGVYVTANAETPTEGTSGAIPRTVVLNTLPIRILTAPHATES